MCRTHIDFVSYVHADLRIRIKHNVIKDNEKKKKKEETNEKIKVHSGTRTRDVQR